MNAEGGPLADERDTDPRMEFEILPVATPSPASERMEWLRPPELPGVHVIRIENSRLLLRMFHATYSMTALFRANAEWHCKGVTHRSGTGDVVLWEPGDFHRCLAHHGSDEVRGKDATATQTGMVIRPDIVERFASECGIRRSRLHVRQRAVSDSEVFDSQRRFYASLSRPATSLERQSRFAECLRLLFERALETRWTPTESGDEDALVHRARHYIEDRYAENISLQELADLTGLDRFQLLRRFKRRMGVPPHQYQIEVRITRARQLLDRNLTPAQVAADVGFSDQSHFTRLFKRVWRVKPAEYLRLR